MNAATATSQLVAILTLLTCVQAGYKRWNVDTNFDNPLNWNAGRLPCPNDRIVFPTTAPEVFLPQDYTISSMILPMTGALILAADGLTLVFNNDPTSPEECPGIVITFNHSFPDAWLNPSSWCIPLHDFDDECVSEPQLDTEYVPCTYDDVLFPREGYSYYASIDLPQMTYVRSVQIDNTYHTTDSFRDYVQTKTGHRRFTGTGLHPLLLNIQGPSYACDDPSGCACGTGNNDALNRAICAYRKCTTPQCSNAFTPSGHCCPVCGSKMELVYEPATNVTDGFDLVKFRLLLQEDFIDKKDRDFGTVRIVLSKLQTDVVQLVLIDDDFGKQAAVMGTALYTQLQTDANFKKTAAVKQPQAFKSSSQGSATTTGSQTTLKSTTPGRVPPSTDGGQGKWPITTSAYTDFSSEADIIVGVVSGAVVLLLLALVVVFYRAKKAQQPPAHDNLAVSINFDDANEPVAVLRGMVNPTYNTPVPSNITPASAQRRNDYVVSVSFADPESPASIIQKASASIKDKKNKKKGSSKQNISLENPLYDGQETSLGPNPTTVQSVTSPLPSGAKRNEKTSTTGLINPLYEQQEQKKQDSKPETIGPGSPSVCINPTFDPFSFSDS